MVKTDHPLHTFMAQVTSEMASEYARIFAKAAEDPGTAGDEGEENWATLLRNWLPPAYHIATKGRLIGSDGQMSNQIDVLVLKPFYPQKLREKKVWLANGVAAAFECKSTLRPEHIAASAEHCRKMKALFPKRTGSPERELRSSLTYGILAHSHAWKAPASKPADNVTAAVWQTDSKSTQPSDLIDVICLADVGCWSRMWMPFYKAEFQPDPEDLQAVFGGSWGPATSMSQTTVDKHNHFQPIGGMLAYLTQRLARNDQAVRDLADYYRLANLWGSGGGSMRFWAQSIFTEEVRRGIENGGMTNGDLWSEWNAALI